MATKNLRFKKAKNNKRFSKHNRINFLKFIRLLMQNCTLPITEEGVKFGQANGYAVFTNHKPGESGIKTASIFFQGKRGKIVLTLYKGPVKRFVDDNAEVVKNTFNVVGAPYSVVVQVNSKIRTWLD